MGKRRPDKQREDFIYDEIVVDAYDASERATAWYSYLDEMLAFPFDAACKEERQISPLRRKEKVEVLGLADEWECQREMFVTIRWNDRELAVPLAQLHPVPATDSPTQEAIAHWHYWMSQGYEF